MNNDCLPCSLAMVLDMSVYDVKQAFPLHNTLRNDGTTRGTHIQEVISWLRPKGYAVTVVEDRAFFEDGTEVESQSDRFDQMINSTKGILIGINIRGNVHACANIHGSIYDPARKGGSKHTIEKFFQYWIIDPIK